MKKQVFFLLLFMYFFLANPIYCQIKEKPTKTKAVSELFRNQELLSIKLKYSNKEVDQNTNDSTYINTNLAYKDTDGTWKNIEVGLRARGNFRRKNCYFSPIKIKIKKANAKGTLFKGNKKLKLVLPCFKGNSGNDDLIKERIAYKLYETISPYHFKTRTVAINFTEERRNKTVEHKLMGILIEDDKKVANRYNGKRMKRFMHPLSQDAICSVQNAFFQFMIANTDYSTAVQHNEKLFFIDKRIIPVPYDFDMSGLVDASYALVSEVQNEALPITTVTERMYRGFNRKESVLQQVRAEFLENKDKMLKDIDSFESLFYNPKEFRIARKFILSFFEILMSDIQFKNQIITMARSK